MLLRKLNIFLLLLLLKFCNGLFYSENESVIDKKQCFCELQGTIDDCSCDVDTVDYYNNVKIYPRLKSVLQNNYFRFYKVNLKMNCPFWPDDSKCNMKSCSVEMCEEKDIPLGLKGNSELNKYTREAQNMPACGDKKDLGYLNTSISDKVHEELQKWSDYDDAQEDFCIIDDNQDESEFVDLLLNPERYTGYRGESATRVWESIYLENCFKSQNPTIRKSYSPFIPYKDLNGVCLEERVFYRMVSGLHSSINIHLCANYLLSEKTSHSAFAPPTGVWGPNIEEFKTRFSPEKTDNEGSTWLRNLYFAYIIELRALAKIAPYLRNEEYYTGFEQDDKEVQMAIRDLLNVIQSFPTHFNESLMFNGTSSKLKNEFREKFRNISKIMDCVGCDKCRLWGKLQIQGMGTALKILFSGKFDQDKLDNTMFESRLNKNQFKLKRTEIVSLLNAFGRLSNSIYHLEVFRGQLRR